MPRLPTPLRAVHALFLAALLGGLAPSAVAAPLAVTAEEEALLRAREIVVRPLASRSEGGVRVFAVVDIHAGRAAVWGALLDFPGRLKSNTAVKSVEHYRPSTPTDQWVRWEVSKFGFSIGYHNHYALDVAAGRLSHELDTTKENDLAGSRGVYDLLPSPAGADWTRLAYECESNFGQAMPEFVQRWMSTGATRDFMADMAARAEALQ
ncbi:MAG: SRPBCC family protein [Pseudomonadota bacterium]|nr:SRPBCC family protein [Pseudomonadota bacterium]